MNILTDEEINDIFRGSWNCEEDNLTRGRDIESAVVEKLPSLGFVRLKPGQVVAWQQCPKCGYFVEATGVDPEGNVEVKP